MYVSRATDIDWRDTSTVSAAEEKRERSTILCNIYLSRLLIYLALPIPSYALATPLMTSPFYPPPCRHIPISRTTLLRVSSSSSSSSSHPPPVLSISAPSFLRSLVRSTSHIYRLIRPPARPFVYLAITIVDRYDVGYTPRR